MAEKKPASAGDDPLTVATLKLKRANSDVLKAKLVKYGYEAKDVQSWSREDMISVILKLKALLPGDVPPRVVEKPKSEMSEMMMLIIQMKADAAAAEQRVAAQIAATEKIRRDEMAAAEKLRREEITAAAAQLAAAEALRREELAAAEKLRREELTAAAAQLAAAETLRREELAESVAAAKRAEVLRREELTAAHSREEREPRGPQQPLRKLNNSVGMSLQLNLQKLKRDLTKKSGFETKRIRDGMLERKRGGRRKSWSKPVETTSLRHTEVF